MIPDVVALIVFIAGLTLLCLGIYIRSKKVWIAIIFDTEEDYAIIEVFPSHDDALHFQYLFGLEEGIEKNDDRYRFIIADSHIH